MKPKGAFILASLLWCLSIVRGATPQSSTDLWDLSKGAVVTASSGTFESSATLGMFGGAGFGSEPGSTIFSGGAPQFVEWTTPAAVTVNQIRLFTRGDGDTTTREFSKFVLKIKSSGSSTFDQTVFTWNPPLPLVQLDTSSWMVLNTNISSFTARAFRAEFTAISGGTRIMEMDAFGPPPTEPAKITLAPTSQSIFVGQTATFSVDVSGAGPLSVQWLHDGAPVTITGDHTQLLDGHTLLIRNAVLEDSGSYKLLVTNQFGSDERTVTLSVEGQPAQITVPPTPISIFVGQSATFAVNVFGTLPLSIQWTHDGAPVTITGDHLQLIDGHSLFIKNATLDDAGSYKLTVTNQFGVAESAAVSLAVQVDDTSPVVTILKPVPGTYRGAANFEGTVTDNQAVTSVRWEKNGIAMGTLALVGGSFSVPNVSLQNGENLLKVIATDPVGNVGFADVTVTSSLVLQSQDDLFDVHQGTVVTGTSGLLSGITDPGMLGGSDSLEPGNTVFASGRTNGFVHTIDWRTFASVTVTNVKVFARGDLSTSYREFSQFTLKAKSPGSSTFDLTVFSYTPPTLPWPFLDPDSFLMLDTNFTAVTAQEFRAEVVQFDNGPRIMEVDGFGPSSTGPPVVIDQPSDVTAFGGSMAILSAHVSGASPLHFQWQHANTNLAGSSRIVGVNSSVLKISNIQAGDAGIYSLAITNPAGNTMSSNAVVTIGVDTAAPVVTITSPTAGNVGDETLTIEGTVVENDRIVSLRWYRNGTNMGPVPFTGSQFLLAGQRLLAGDNVIRVVAIDGSGNEGSAQVTTQWSPNRAVILEMPAPRQEGARMTVPISLISTGGISAATFVVGFDTNLVTDPQFEWISEGDLGLTSVNLESNKRYRASFALAGTALSGGTRTLGNVSFRTRSVSTNRTVNFTMDLVGFYGPTGDQYLTGNYVQGSSGLITKRKVTGDNNANDRLDVGDATVILRFASRLDLPKSWDITGNDLNKNNDVDSGDVVRVLRAVVGIDPQPLVPAGLKAADGGAIPVDGQLSLVADKSTANAGEKITVEARISGKTRPIEGASFRLEYPVGALRLENSTAHQPGALVPASGALLAWNVSPSVTDYANQNGAISFGVSSATSWPANNGVLARFTFTVQAAAAGRYTWPMFIRNGETTSDGFRTDSLGTASLNFVARAPAPANFEPSVHFDASGSSKLILQGDLGATYVVHGSSDLSTWKIIGTYSTTTSSTIEINDPEATGAATRFYRATLIQ